MRTSGGDEQADVLPPGTVLAFGVLGRLELRVGHAPWEVHGGRERMVLAMLLTAPGRVVSVSSLVAGLWGDDPPGGADKAVQTYVSRLRSSLPGHGEGLVLTRSPGYVVAVAPDQVDAEEFRRLAASGRHQLATGSAEEAGSTLRAALDLWRGEAYMEFDAPFAALARTALEEERVATLADRIEAELMLGRGPELVGELESLVSTHPWQERLWAQLMIALYRSGRQSDALIAFHRARSELRDELGVDPGPELRAVEGMVLAQDPRLTAATQVDPSPDGSGRWSAFPRQPVGNGPERRVVRPDVVCPFKGLAHYEVEDAPYFFGRARLVDRLITRLVDRPLLAVVGPSGSGKSSVLRAGIVARIRSGVLPGSQEWRVVVTHPSDAHPDIPDGRALIVVDGLEEMFTALAPSEQAAYAEWLIAAAASPTATVVVALRADYYGRLTAHQALAELVAANTVPIGPLSPDELREAVEGPLAEAHLAVEPGLTDLVVAEVVGEPGALPLLSAALLSLWEGRRDDRLTIAAYHELGGVRSAVAQLGERFYAQLPSGRRHTARRVLVRLADGSSGGPPVRRRLSFAEVGLETDAEVRAVVDALATGRLVTLSEAHVQVAHEALLREWPRLRAWLEDDEAGERLRRQLAPHTLEWDDGGRPDSELYRGHRLASALEWLAEHPEDLTTLETEFLRASREATEKASADRRRSVRRLRALAATLAVALVLAAVLGGVALSERNEARSSAETAAAAELDADVRALRAQALAEPRTDLALLLAAQAYRMEPSEASRSTMLTVAQRSPELVAIHRADQQLQHLVASADSDTVAAVGSDGGVYAWSSDTGELVATVPRVAYFGGTSLDLSPDGRQLVVVGIRVPEDPKDLVLKGQALVIDLSSPRPTARTLPGPALVGARFAADGRTLVLLGVDGRVRLVDASTGEARRPGRTSDIAAPKARIMGETTTLEGSANRRFLVATDREGGGPVTVWAVGSGKVLWSEPQRAGTVAAVNSDGDGLVLAHADGSLELVSLAEGTRRSVPTGAAGGVTDLAWSPDGGEFAGAASDGTVTTWDARSLDPTRALRGHTGGVRGVDYSLDGSRLYAAGDDGSVLAWQLSGGNGLVRPIKGAAAPGAIGSRISADGSLVATELPGDVVRLFDVDRNAADRVEWETPFGGADSIVAPDGQYVGHVSAGWPTAALATVRVVDVARLEQLPYTVKLEPDRAFDAAFSGDGRTLVTTDDRVVVARDVRTGRRLPGTGRYLAQDLVADVGVDRRARRMALSVVSGAVEVVDVTQGQRLTVLDVPRTVRGTASMHHLTFSPDGRWLAAGSDAGAAVVWDTRSWEVHETWTVDGGAVQSLAFAEDSAALIIGGGGEASVRELIGSGEATVSVGSLHDAEWISVASRENGRVLVTHTDVLGVQLWQVGPQSLLTHACAVAGRELTPEEWEAALPDRAYAPTCGPSEPDDVVR